MLAALFCRNVVGSKCFLGGNVMADTVLARGLPAKSRRQRSERASSPIGVMSRTFTPVYFFSYAFHRYAHLVRRDAEDYSVSPKISAVSGRNTWPL